MFEDALILPASRIKTASWAFPLSLVAHASVAAALILIPLLRPAHLPPFQITGAFLAPARALPLPPPPPPPPGRLSSAKKAGRKSPVQVRPPLAPGRWIAPVEVPQGFEDELIADFGMDGGVPGGVPGGIDGGVLSGIPGHILDVLAGEAEAPLPAVGQVRPPRLIKRVEPVYPELARETHTEGLVIIEARTDIYGRVADLKVLRSVPLLEEAALEAVRQWVYEPSVINGRPRGVIFTVCVRFVLK